MTVVFDSDLYFSAVMLLYIFFYLFSNESTVYTDALTGLNNRNNLNRQLLNVLDSSLRYHAYLTYIDIDEFKKINDNYGHLMGDLVLRTVAESMKDTADSIPMLTARIGGDEFVVLSHHSNRKELDAMIELLKVNLKKKIEVNCPNLDVQFSVGSTPLNVGSEFNFTLNEYIKLADRRMYSQKLKKKGLA